MRSRSVQILAAMLLGVFLLSPPFGQTISATASSTTTLAVPSTIYLPLMLRNYPPQTVFGAEMYTLNSSGGLDQMVAADSSWTRRNAVTWSSVETTEGARNWGALSDLETELKNASSKGLKVILIVRSTPEWARKTAGSGSYCGPIRSDKMAAFGNFMRDLVTRYSAPPYNVKYWELWNEPDIDPSLVLPDSIYGCWGNQADAYYGGGYYAEMLKAAYPQIKAANSQAQVLVGGLLMDCDPRPGAGCATTGSNALPGKFLEGILLNNGAPYFDGVSFHAYDYYLGQLGQYYNPNWQSAWNTTGPVLIAKAQFIKSLLSQYSVSGKFLMNTESAILCDTCSSDTTFETTKAYYVTQAYTTAIVQGLQANIWYNVPGWRNSGLLYPDLSPRPAYTAFQVARGKLQDFTYIGEVTAAELGGVSGVRGYKLKGVWVLWSLDGADHLVTLSSVPVAAWDAAGNPVTPASLMNISLNPLYLEFNP